MIHKVYLATLPNGFFISAGQSWLSVDVAYIVKELEAAGFVVNRISVDEIASLEFATGDFILYTSSPDKNVRDYIKNVLYFPSKKCNLVPKYEFILAHEDKGFQELLKSNAGIKGLKAFYHYDVNAYNEKLPVVFKTVDGAGSSGVRLVNSSADMRKIVRKYFSITWKRKLIIAFRRLKLKVDQFEYYRYRHKTFRPHVFQQFVKGLNSDYKVLVFGNKYFGLKRYTRKGDFRASGSGRFDSKAELPMEVLEYAKLIFDKMDVPFLSLDLAMSDDQCHLIEYQALNFGPLTLNNSLFHYVEGNGEWVKIESKSDINKCYAEAYVRHIKRTLRIMSP